MIRVFNSRRMRWAGYVERMGRGKVPTGFCWGNLRDRDHSEDLGIDGKMLKLIFKKKWYGMD
jgi:hypothetical protein